MLLLMLLLKLLLMPNVNAITNAHIKTNPIANASAKTKYYDSGSYATLTMR